MPPVVVQELKLLKEQLKQHEKGLLEARNRFLHALKLVLASMRIELSEQSVVDTDQLDNGVLILRKADQGASPPANPVSSSPAE